MPSDRLSQVEKQLESLYAQYNEVEDDITNNQNPVARAQSKQQLKNLNSKIHQYEEEYLQVLQQQATELTFVETDAQAVIDVVAEKVAQIEANRSFYSDEILEHVRSIREKLEQPGTSAALKIKPVISLLPPGIAVSIEGDLNAVSLLRKSFSTFTRLTQGAKPKK